MRRAIRIRRLSLAAVVLVLALAGVLTAADADRPPLPRADIQVSVGSATAAPPVAPGFLGLSLEFQALGYYTGPQGPDRVLEQLIRNLSPGHPPVLRIGGDSTDHSWWPVRGVRIVPGLRYALGPAWAAGVRRLVSDLDARVILGINLEADSTRLAAAEARQLVARIGPRYVQSLELGNEPNLYGTLPWWVRPSGRWVRGRPPGYSPADYERDLARMARALPRLPLAGPALGNLQWMASLPGIVRAAPRIGDVTFHRYPLNRCFTHPGQLTYPTLANLLSPVASRGLAASIAPFARFSRAHRISFRVDEMNSVACEGKAGISDTFASALWAADALFAMAAEGVTGVNLHTFPGARYRLFDLSFAGGRWSADVAPVYYGALLFERAAPAGARLLSVARGGGSDVRVWATSGGSPRAVRILLINDSVRRRHVIQVRVPAPAAGATLQRLLAPGLTASSGVTLAGQAFAGATTTGRLAGTPQLVAAPRAGHGYRISLPPASSALLIVPSPARG